MPNLKAVDKLKLSRNKEGFGTLNHYKGKRISFGKREKKGRESKKTTTYYDDQVNDSKREKKKKVRT